MTPETLVALKRSIHKWRKIVAGESGDHGSDDCALCVLHQHQFNCFGCPVSERVSNHYCRGTPYTYWVSGVNRLSGDAVRRVTDDRSRGLAQAELDFLISLLPPGEIA